MWDGILTDSVKEGVIAVLTASLGWIAFKIRSLAKEAHDRRSEAAILASGEIVNILYQECGVLQADKVCLMYTSNGGGIPHPGKQLYLTILYEIFNGENLASAWDNYQKLPCDSPLIKCISNIIQNTCTYLKVADLEDGLLKSYSKREKVDYLFLFPVMSTNSQYFFLMIKWTGEPTLGEDEVRSICLPLAEKIKQTISKFGVG